MDLDFNLLASILFGAFSGSILTAIITHEKSKKDFCLKVYEQWISNPLSQNRSEVLSQLKAFFDEPLPDGGKWSDRKIKLSELHYLSKPSPNYQPQIFSQDFVSKFISILIFLDDLNKFLKSGLIDIKLTQILFTSNILPWYKYIERIEFDRIENIEYLFTISEINSLKKKLISHFPNEVSILHLNYLLLEQNYLTLQKKYNHLSENLTPRKFF